MAKNYTTNHINVINAENPVRMGFYVPGCGIVTKIREPKVSTAAEMMKNAIENSKRMEQNKK